MNWTKTLIPIIALVSVYVVFFLFSDMNKVFITMVSINKMYFALSIIPWVIVGFTGCLRWHFFLRKITDKIPFHISALYYLAGYALVISPGGAGAIIRSPFIKKNYGIPISQTAPIILVERFYDLLGIILVIIVGLIFSNFEKSVVILPIIFALVIFIIIRNKSLFITILKKLAKIKIINKIIPDVEESYDVISNLMGPRYIIVGVATSFVNGFLMVSSILLLILGMNATIGFSDLLVIFPVSDFAATASFIPGGIGVLEGGLLGLLVLYKIKYEIALSVTILVRFLSTGLFFAIGVICLRIISREKKTPTS